jgi:hypothetical protein
MKRALLVVMMLCSSAVAAEPVFKLRLYDSQAKFLADNLAVTNLHKADTAYALIEVYLLPNADLVSLQARIQQLRHLGIHVVPGMRAFKHNEIADYVNIEHWRSMAAELTAIAAMRSDADPRIYIDLENYFSESEAAAFVIDPLGGKPALAKAMEPFLATIRKFKIVPCLTPAVLEDFAEQLCAENSNSSEWLNEGLFYAEKNYRNNRQSFGDILITGHKHRRAVHDKFPTAKWTPGLLDGAMRLWSTPFHAGARQAFAEPDCWIFLDDRRDEMSLGTRQWLNGLSLSPLNDAWWYQGGDEYLGRHRFDEDWMAPDGATVSSGHAGPRRRDPVTDTAYWPADRRFLSDRSLTFGHVTKPFVLAMDVFVVSKDAASLCGVWLHRQEGYQSYQIRLNGTKSLWSFDYCDPNKKMFRDAITVPAKIGAWQRICLFIAGGKISLSCDDEARRIEKEIIDAPTIPLTIGLGEHNGVLFGEPLRIRNLQYWQRTLSRSELVTVRSGAFYPF